MTDKEKSQVRRDAQAALWGMVGAWAWARWGKPLLQRVPIRWQIIGGLVLVVFLALVARMPELAVPVLLATLGLIGEAIYHRTHRRAGVSTAVDEMVRRWAEIVEDNEKLRKVLRGSVPAILEADETGFTIGLELANGYTPADVAVLTPNLESVFRTEPGALRVMPDPRASWRALLRAGHNRPPIYRPRAPEDEPSGPVIEGVARPVEGGGSGVARKGFAALLLGPTRGAAPARAPARARGPIGKATEAVRQAELKRQAADARRNGQRRHKGGHRRRA